MHTPVRKVCPSHGAPSWASSGGAASHRFAKRMAEAVKRLSHTCGLVAPKCSLPSLLSRAQVLPPIPAVSRPNAPSHRCGLAPKGVLPSLRSRVQMRPPIAAVSRPDASSHRCGLAVSRPNASSHPRGLAPKCSLPAPRSCAQMRPPIPAVSRPNVPSQIFPAKSSRPNRLAFVLRVSASQGQSRAWPFYERGDVPGRFPFAL